MKRHFQILIAALAAPAALTATGCGNKDFAKVNGQVVTKEEYLHALERTAVPLGPGVNMPAERMVIDQLIGKKVIAAQAAQLGVTPSNEDIDKVYRIQQGLFENAQPGKKYEEEMAKQGMTPEGVKDDLRNQLSEAAVLAKMLNIGDAEVRKFYDEHREEFGLPARTQVRLIILDPKSPQYAEATKRLADKNADFAKIAKELNVILQLKATSGLQVLDNQRGIPAPLQGQVAQTSEGAVLGPVDWAQGAKAWIKVEKKLPQYNIPVDEALPLVRQRVVQDKIRDPKNAKIKNDIMKLKLDAKFEPSEASYNTVWEAIKQQAVDAGLGQNTAAAPALSAPAPESSAAPK